MSSTNSQATSIPVHYHMSRTQRLIKRSCDATLAALALIVLSPLLLVLCLLQTLDGEGAIFYRQERIGLGGRPFNILKFRTMKVNAEANGPQLEVPDDPRLTRLGCYLRRHHLDELPQLWNVLVGDMAIVGPRPERAFFIRQIMEKDTRYACLFQVRPGLTSDATLYNGYTTTIDKMLQRLELDLHYLEHASLSHDICIILKTIRLVVCGDKVIARTSKAGAVNETN